MAKKQTPQQQTQARILRTEAYAEKVRRLFAYTVNQICEMNKRMPDIANGVMYSFDGDSKKVQHEVETLLRQLHAVTTAAIKQGIVLEWEQANEECDKLVQSCFGREVLKDPKFTAYASHNERAMNSFIARSERGLNLSDRVWKSVRQLRDEMEVAITVSVGEGASAQQISKRVRQYLDDPDLMFRRFRYKIGEEEIKDDDGNVIGTKPVFGRKWKKRIKKDDGSYGWIDYDRDTYRTGNGVYKSSAKNAMRVARTETNIAYRRADNERWSQLDFVLGQHIQLSKKHPKKDICDELQGDYPVEFVFEGWHPQCFCFVTPILMPEDEMRKARQARLRGEHYTPRAKRITDYPARFKSWCTENADKIAASHDVGQDPYFVRHNYDIVQRIIDPTAAEPTLLEKQTQQIDKLQQALQDGYLPKETAATLDKLRSLADAGDDAAAQEFERRASLLQAAADRHAARTPEKVADIKQRWQERNEFNAASSQAEQLTALAAGTNIDTSAFAQAIKMRDTAQVKQLVDEVKQRLKHIKLAADNVAKLASDYGEVDATALNDLLNADEFNYGAVQQATRKLAQDILVQKKAEQAISDIIPDAHKWHQQFSMKELQAAHKAAENTLKSNMGKYYTQDITKLSLSELQAYKSKLEYEADWKKTHPKYSTDAVVEDVYRKRLKAVEEEIKWRDIKQKHQDYLKKLSATFPHLTQELTNAIKAQDFAAANAAVTRLQQWESVITQRTQIATAFGSANADMLKSIDAAIKANDVTAANKELTKLASWQAILTKRAELSAALGGYSSLFTELDDAIKNNKPLVAKKAISVLERWEKVVLLYNAAQSIKQTDEIKKKLKSLKTAITSKKIDDAEIVAAELQKLTMSPAELYCQQHYTEEFTVHSQSSYDDVMQEMGRQSKPIWQAATTNQKQAFVDYCGSYSQQMLSDIAQGRKNERVERIDAVMKQIHYPKDIVLRSGQNFCMAGYIFNSDFERLLRDGKIDELNAKYAGLIGKNVAYMSTSFNENGGFRKQFEFHLFCPKGTSMMNVYVLSPYGEGEGIHWNGESYPKTWSRGGETEIFLGRDLYYKFIRAEAGAGMGGTTRVYVQVLGVTL